MTNWVEQHIYLAVECSCTGRRPCRSARMILLTSSTTGPKWSWCFSAVIYQTVLLLNRMQFIELHVCRHGVNIPFWGLLSMLWASVECVLWDEVAPNLEVRFVSPGCYLQRSKLYRCQNCLRSQPDVGVEQLRRDLPSTSQEIMRNSIVSPT